MSNDINLLKKTGKNKNIVNYLLIFKIISYGFLSLSIIVGIIFFYLGKSSDPSYVVQQESYVRNKLTLQSSKISKLLFIKDRINKINNILKTRENFDKILEPIITNLPSSVTVDSLSIDKNELSASFISTDLLDINNVSNFLSSLSGKNALFKQLTVDSVLLDGQSGKYVLSITGITNN